jgi:hypothetical protein
MSVYKCVMFSLRVIACLGCPLSLLLSFGYELLITSSSVTGVVGCSPTRWNEHLYQIVELCS